MREEERKGEEYKGCIRKEIDGIRLSKVAKYKHKAQRIE